MGAFITELFRGGFYKRTQGKIVRQATFFALAGGLILGLYLFFLSDSGPGYNLSAGVRSALFLLCSAAVAWGCFRLVQMPDFAEFLIQVEAEMVKVSWPTFDQVWKATGVVLFVMTFLASVLFTYDFFLKQVILKGINLAWKFWSNG